MRLHDTIVGLLFVALGLAVLLVARTFPMMPGQDIGPATFPKLIGAGMALGGAVVAGLGLWRTRSAAILALDPGWRKPPRLACVAFCLLGGLGFALWFEEIGFPLGALVMCTGLLLLSGQRKPWIFAMAAAFVAVVMLVMTRLLSVPLPMGAWL